MREFEFKVEFTFTLRCDVEVSCMFWRRGARASGIGSNQAREFGIGGTFPRRLRDTLQSEL
jgi:hypothetical protein